MGSIDFLQLFSYNIYGAYQFLLGRFFVSISNFAVSFVEMNIIRAFLNTFVP